MAKFTNIDKYCLWDMASIQTKRDDEDTTQLFYGGEDRGQTQRYLISLGDLIKTFFDEIDNLYKWADPFAMDKDFFEHIQRLFNAMFFRATVPNEKLVRNMLEEIINAWKLKGTASFLHWIIWKVFGWQVLYVISLHSTMLKYNLSGYTLYYPGQSEFEWKKLYDPAMLGVNAITIIIDVFSDTDYNEKKETLESLALGWNHTVVFQYVNTP